MSTPGADFATANVASNGFVVKQFAGADNLVAALNKGTVDAVVQDSPINGYAAVSSNGALAVSKVFETEGEQYGFVVSKEVELARNQVESC